MTSRPLAPGTGDRERSPLLEPHLSVRATETARRWSRRRRALVGLSALVIAVAGCGGASPLARSAPTVPTVPTTTAPSSGAPSTSAPSTTGPTTTGPTTTAPSTSSPPTSVTPPTTAPVTPQESAQARALLAVAQRDGQAERWAHVNGTELATVAGPDRGSQTYTSGSLVGLIKVLPNATYIHGSALALERIFGVPAAAAIRVAGKWVVLTRADREYKSVTVGVTLPSELQLLNMSGSLRSEPYNSNGKRGTLISGSLPAANGVPNGYGALLVTSGPHPLPEEFAEFDHAKAAVMVETFSLWGVSEAVNAPAGAVALPKIPSRGAVS